MATTLKHQNDVENKVLREKKKKGPFMYCVDQDQIGHGAKSDHQSTLSDKEILFFP